MEMFLRRCLFLVEFLTFDHEMAFTLDSLWIFQTFPILKRCSTLNISEETRGLFLNLLRFDKHQYIHTSRETASKRQLQRFFPLLVLLSGNLSRTISAISMSQIHLNAGQERKVTEKLHSEYWYTGASCWNPEDYSVSRYINHTLITFTLNKVEKLTRVCEDVWQICFCCVLFL